VKKNNFGGFRQGIPTKDPILARKMFNSIRNNLNEELLDEGIYDPGILKAVFLAGGPGSGKDYIMKHTVGDLGLTEINSDKAFEFLLKKQRLALTMPDSQMHQRDMIRGRAKSIMNEKQRLSFIGRLGLIINGTADNYDKVSRIKKDLEELGYTCMMLYIHTTNEVSKFRNIKRGEDGGRTVPEPIRSEKWLSSQKNRNNFQSLFGKNFIEIDNNIDVNNANDETKKDFKRELLRIYKLIRKFVKLEKIQNPQGLNWIKKVKDMRNIKEQQLDELSRKKLSNYIKKSLINADKLTKNNKYKTKTENAITYQDVDSAKVGGVSVSGLGRGYSISVKEETQLQKIKRMIGK
ncbi:MAG: zeta toxin family protein, partial [Candidatus Paceibacterota bacterium]